MKHVRLPKVLLLKLTPVTALLLCFAAVTLPLYTIKPGAAREVVPQIDIEGHRTYQPRGRLLLTAVNVRTPTVYEAIAALFSETTELVPEREVLPRGQTQREYLRETRSQMDESTIAAAAVALEQATDYPEAHGTGALVQNTVRGTPAFGRLFPGDVIVSIDGESVREVSDVSDAIERAGVERAVEVEVEVDGERETIGLRPAQVPGQERPVIGVVLVEAFPFEIAIDAAGVGGPSAGLMWALGLLDLLVPGELTAGRTVAGTGSIDLDGRVHSVGGIGHKLHAAEGAGADLFILPRANMQEARRADVQITLVPVDTVGQALAYLEEGSV